MAHRGGQL